MPSFLFQDLRMSARLCFALSTSCLVSNTALMAEGAQKKTIETLPIMTLPATEVCSGIAYINNKGDRTEGVKNCQVVPCNKPNQTGCLTTVDHPSFEKKAVEAEHIVRGYSIGGIQGTFNPHAPKPVACTKHGDSACVSNVAFPAVERAKITAGNIVKGTVFPGMATGAYPSQQYPLPGYDPAHKMLTSTNLSSALQHTGNLQFWTIRGERQVVAADVGLAPANIPAGKSIHGIKGKMKRDTFPVCNKDGQYNCQVKQGYLAVKATDLLPENFRNGVKVSDSITGTYPSAATPLAAASATVPDLRADTFRQRMASDSTFEFFDRFGRRYRARGDSNVVPSHIKAGVTLWGTPGRFQGTLADENFDEFDILKGHSLGDIKGKLDPFCATNGTCRPDFWLDRSVNNEGKLTKCNSGSARNCVFYHKITKRTWLFPKVESTMDWAASTALCKGERFDGHSDWRLPSQKEAMQAMAQGMKALPFHQRYSKKFEGSERFWTSTGGAGKGRVYFAPKTGAGSQAVENNGFAVYPACIR